MQIVVSGREDIQLYRHYPGRDTNGDIMRNWYYLQWMTTGMPEIGYWLCARVGPTSSRPANQPAGMLRVRGYSGGLVAGEHSQFVWSPDDAMCIAMKHAASRYRRFISDAYGRVACCSPWQLRLDTIFAYDAGVLEPVYADNC